MRQASVLFGRRVFRVLLATRHKTEKARGKRLARARTWADTRAVPTQAAECLQARVSDLFCDMEKEGELDWLPDKEHARKVMFGSARRRLLTDWNMCRQEDAIERKQLDEYLKLSEPVIAGAVKLLEAAGITGSNLGNYRGFIPAFIRIAGSPPGLVHLSGCRSWITCSPSLPGAGTTSHSCANLPGSCSNAGTPSIRRPQPDPPNRSYSLSRSRKREYPCRSSTCYGDALS